MKDKIEKCICGKIAQTEGLGRSLFVRCGPRNEPVWCWSGPQRRTKRTAIAAWNRVMQAARKDIDAATAKVLVSQ